MQTADGLTAAKRRDEYIAEREQMADLLDSKGDHAGAAHCRAQAEHVRSGAPTLHPTKDDYARAAGQAKAAVGTPAWADRHRRLARASRTIHAGTPGQAARARHYERRIDATVRHRARRLADRQRPARPPAHRARSLCGGRRRPGARRAARARSPGGSRGDADEPKPAGRHVARRSIRAGVRG